MHIVENLNINETKAIITPNDFKKQYPLTEKAQDFIYDSRQVIEKILSVQSVKPRPSGFQQIATGIQGLVL